MATVNHPTAPSVAQFPLPHIRICNRSRGAPLPCPFCGNTQLVKIWAADPDGDGEGADARVQCGQCSAEGPVTSSVPNAVRAWNIRQAVDRG